MAAVRYEALPGAQVWGTGWQEMTEVGVPLRGSVLVLDVEVGTAEGSGQLRLLARELELRGELREFLPTGRGGGAHVRIRSSQLYGFENVEIRLHRTVLYTSIYRSDDQLLVNQHVYGIPAAHSPVFAFRKAADGLMANTYLEAFGRVWADAAEPR